MVGKEGGPTPGEMGAGDPKKEKKPGMFRRAAEAVGSAFSKKKTPAPAEEPVVNPSKKGIPISPPTGERKVDSKVIIKPGVGNRVEKAEDKSKVVPTMDSFVADLGPEQAADDKGSQPVIQPDVAQPAAAETPTSDFSFFDEIPDTVDEPIAPPAKFAVQETSDADAEAARLLAEKQAAEAEAAAAAAAEVESKRKELAEKPIDFSKLRTDVRVLNSSRKTDEASVKARDEKIAEIYNEYGINWTPGMTPDQAAEAAKKVADEKAKTTSEPLTASATPAGEPPDLPASSLADEPSSHQSRTFDLDALLAEIDNPPAQPSESRSMPELSAPDTIPSGYEDLYHDDQALRDPSWNVRYRNGLEADFERKYGVKWSADRTTQDMIAEAQEIENKKAAAQQGEPAFVLGDSSIDPDAAKGVGFDLDGTAQPPVAAPASRFVLNDPELEDALPPPTAESLPQPPPGPLPGLTPEALVAAGEAAMASPEGALPIEPDPAIQAKIEKLSKALEEYAALNVEKQGRWGKLTNLFNRTRLNQKKAMWANIAVMAASIGANLLGPTGQLASAVGRLVYAPFMGGTVKQRSEYEKMQQKELASLPRLDTGELDLAKIEQMDDIALAETIGSLTQISSLKGLEINDALFELEEKDLAERAAKKKESRATQIIEGIGSKWDKVKPGWKIAISLGLLAGGVALPSYFLAFAAVQYATGALSARNEVSRKSYEHTDVVKALFGVLAKKVQGRDEEGIKRTELSIAKGQAQTEANAKIAGLKGAITGLAWFGAFTALIGGVQHAKAETAAADQQIAADGKPMPGYHMGDHKGEPGYVDRDLTGADRGAAQPGAAPGTPGAAPGQPGFDPNGPGQHAGAPGSHPDAPVQHGPDEVWPGDHPAPAELRDGLHHSGETIHFRDPHLHQAGPGADKSVATEILRGYLGQQGKEMDAAEFDQRRDMLADLMRERGIFGQNGELIAKESQLSNAVHIDHDLPDILQAKLHIEPTSHAPIHHGADYPSNHIGETPGEAQGETPGETPGQTPAAPGQQTEAPQDQAQPPQDRTDTPAGQTPTESIWAPARPINFLAPEPGMVATVGNGVTPIDVHINRFPEPAFTVDQVPRGDAAPPHITGAPVVDSHSGMGHATHGNISHMPKGGSMSPPEDPNFVDDADDGIDDIDTGVAHIDTRPATAADFGGAAREMGVDKNNPMGTTYTLKGGEVAPGKMPWGMNGVGDTTPGGRTFESHNDLSGLSNAARRDNGLPPIDQTHRTTEVPVHINHASEFTFADKHPNLPQSFFTDLKQSMFTTRLGGDSMDAHGIDLRDTSLNMGGYRDTVVDALSKGQLHNIQNLHDHLQSGNFHADSSEFKWLFGHKPDLGSHKPGELSDDGRFVMKPGWLGKYWAPRMDAITQKALLSITEHTIDAVNKHVGVSDDSSAHNATPVLGPGAPKVAEFHPVEKPLAPGTPLGNDRLDNVGGQFASPAAKQQSALDATIGKVVRDDNPANVIPGR